MHLDRGDYAKGKADLEEALQIYQEAGRQEQHISKVLGFLALLYHSLGEQTQAALCGEEAARLARTLDDPRIEGDALTRCGRVLDSQGRLGEAAELFQQALADFRQTGQDNHTMMPFAGLAEIALRQGEPAQAQHWIELILTHLQTRQLDCTDEELYVYMTGYRVLRAAQDPRSAHLLQLAYQQLQTRAATLDDDHERRLFWSAPPHAEVLIEVKQKRNA
jgi:tetratricopeptide (TPR) repeat protein